MGLISCLSAGFARLCKTLFAVVAIVLTSLGAVVAWIGAENDFAARVLQAVLCKSRLRSDLSFVTAKRGGDAARRNCLGLGQSGHLHHGLLLKLRSPYWVLRVAILWLTPVGHYRHLIEALHRHLLHHQSGLWAHLSASIGHELHLLFVVGVHRREFVLVDRHLLVHLWHEHLLRHESGRLRHSLACVAALTNI